MAVLFAVACLSALSQAQIPSPSPIPQNTPVTPLTLDEALRLANAQASTYQSAVLDERIAAEDVKQARAAFRPKVSAPLLHLYDASAGVATRRAARTELCYE